MYADRMRSTTCRPSRRALAHRRAALGLAKRHRGGQPGNRNRLRHGLYARAFVKSREETRTVLRQTRQLIAALAQSARDMRASTKRQSHRAAVGKAAAFLGADDRTEAFVAFSRRQFDKAVARIERTIPRHVAEGRQRQCTKSAALRPRDSSVDQRTAESAALEILSHRQFDDVQRIARQFAAKFADDAGHRVVDKPNRPGFDERQEFLDRANRFVGDPPKFGQRAEKFARRLFESGQENRIGTIGKTDGGVR